MSNAANETSLRATWKRLTEKVPVVAKQSQPVFKTNNWVYHLGLVVVVPSVEVLEDTLHSLLGTALEVALSQDKTISVSAGRFQVSLFRDTETSWSGRIDLIAQSWIEPGLDVLNMSR